MFNIINMRNFLDYKLFLIVFLCIIVFFLYREFENVLSRVNKMEIEFKNVKKYNALVIENLKESNLDENNLDENNLNENNLHKTNDKFQEYYIENTDLPDVYNLYNCNLHINFFDIAYIPNIKSSNFVRNIFINKPLNTKIKVKCKFIKNFNKWTPIKVIK